MKLSQPVPDLLTGAPFTVAEALERGVSRRRLLSSPLFRPVCRGIHVAADVPDGAELRLAAVSLLVPSGVVLSGTTAAWVHGVDVRRHPAELIEVTDTRGSRPMARGVLVARRATLAPDDVLDLGAVLVTTVVRTAFDLARRDLVEGVVALDALWRAGLITPEELVEYACGKRHLRGIRQVARVAELADKGAQSPMESRLRMVLVIDAGLPRPETQLEVPDGFGGVLATLDMGYRSYEVGVEFDGAVHDEERNRVRDLRRHNRLRGVSWDVLRYSGADVRLRKHVIKREVREALGLEG
ncbi:MAG: hypothetical protein QOJ11_4511 [Frankiales bacterium]|jgi:hypothetical protein|nr:hypothetical protein [Frankiales bacterium]